MSIKRYEVEVYDSGTIAYFLNNKRHCEHGPAIYFASGMKGYYIDGVKYTEEEFNKKKWTTLFKQNEEIEL